MRRNFRKRVSKSCKGFINDAPLAGRVVPLITLLRSTLRCAFFLKSTLVSLEEGVGISAGFQVKRKISFRGKVVQLRV